jgi:hypothetical protein
LSSAIPVTSILGVCASAGAGVRAFAQSAVRLDSLKLGKQVGSRGAAIALGHGGAFGNGGALAYADAAQAANDAPPRCATGGGRATSGAAGCSGGCTAAAAVAVPPGHAGAALPEPLHHTAVRRQHAAASSAAVAAALGVRHRAPLLHPVDWPAGDAGGQPQLMQPGQAAAADQRPGHGAADARHRILPQSHPAPAAPRDAAPAATGHLGRL